MTAEVDGDESVVTGSLTAVTFRHDLDMQLLRTEFTRDVYAKGKDEDDGEERRSCHGGEKRDDV